MLSPRVYFRLVEPLQSGTLAASAGLRRGRACHPFATATDGRRPAAAAMATLALAWLFCAWQLLWLRYSTINWAMSYATGGLHAAGRSAASRGPVDARRRIAREQTAPAVAASA